MFEIQTGPGAELAVEPAAQTEPQNQTAGGPDDDLIIFMPVSVDIKREPQELALEWAKKCNPNVIIDLMDDEHSINVKTEVNDENLAPNRANAMERSIQRNVVTKKPQKPIVERCVGRICAPIKRPRLYEGTIANQGMDDGATDGADQSENEMVSDSEEEIISQAEGLRTYNELGIIDATDVDFVAIAFQDPATDIDVPAHRQQAGNSISNVSYCQQCGSFHASKNALRKHYTTKKHASKVLELVFETGRKLNATISSESKAWSE